MTARATARPSPLQKFEDDLVATMRMGLDEGAEAIDSGHLVAALTHHIDGGGSRIRARLAHRCALQLMIEEPDALRLAALCELLHSASLIHDDLSDHARTRREAPSVNHAFGDDTALCLGDLFISAAYAMTARLERADLPLAALLQLIHRAITSTIHGQLSASRSTTNPTLEHSIAAACAKTAPLFSLALELPLMVAGEHKAQPLARRACERFALAYQLLDDLDDYDEDVALDPERGNGNLVRCFERELSGSAKEHAMTLLHRCLDQASAEADLLPHDVGGGLKSAVRQLAARALHRTGQRASA
ncbi:polyprenyl synthetase family protein [Halotalea alkalilenta]|uniref:polyprenyl synthetase family protein n=1 Tax=Halotalea alkalilenta TaxID=376489 RepID=UPI00138E0C44|nr:polyprenyl synthetase family protein [Halotalea alkalilenta]